MEEKQSNDHEIAAGVRLLGSLVLIAGIVFLGLSQIKEININPDPANVDVQALLELPKQIAEKTNYMILGGFLTVVGIQLCLVSTKLVSEIKQQFK